MKKRAAHLWLTPIALAVSVGINGCSAGGGESTSNAEGPAGGAPTAATPGPTPVGHGPLRPGRYSAQFAGADASVPRAVLQVPRGFSGFEDFALVEADEYSVLQLGFWMAAMLPTEPCGLAKYVDPGPSVRDLATALVNQKVTESTRPRPTTLAGHHGLRLDLRVPQDLDIDRCPGQHVKLWEDEGGGNRWLAQPGQRARLWILDLDGQRVVVNASDGRTSSYKDIAAVTKMVHSVTFTEPTGTEPGC
jgi:hypothetical protein